MNISFPKQNKNSYIFFKKRTAYLAVTISISCVPLSILYRYTIVDRNNRQEKNLKS